MVALVLFGWGASKYLMAQDEARKHQGMHLIVWSIVIFVLLCLVWSSMHLLQPTFKVTSAQPMIPKSIQLQQGSSGYPAPTLREYSSTGAADLMAKSSAPYEETSVGSVAYPSYIQAADASINDTREFLKTNYNADMHSRDVQGIVKRVETTVRGYGGRVDQTSSSPKFGSVSFIVSAEKFDAFRDELEKMVPPRFLSIHVNSLNLLPQKQNIEVQQEHVEKSLADLESDRAKLVASHSVTSKSLQYQLDSHLAAASAYGLELGNLNIEVSSTDSSSYRYSEIIARISEVSRLLSGSRASQAAIRTKIANENSSYSAQLNSLDSRIKYTDQNLEGVKAQDQKLLDDVATVNGTVSVTWISIWQIVQLYVPASWIALALALCAVVAYWWQRRRESLS